jgi:hypothetical protein
VRKRIAIGMALVLVLMGFVVVMNPAASHNESDPFVTDLIAGGGNEKSAIDVGDVLVWNDDNYLYVKYVIIDETSDDLLDNWYITETHLHVGESLAEFPLTPTDNPKVGHFEYSGEHDFVTEVLYEIPNEWDQDDTVYIGAHAVVEQLTGLDALHALLPDDVDATVYYSVPNKDSYFDTYVSGGGFLAGTYDGWCIDTYHRISPGNEYQMLVLSSYEDIPEGVVDYPENLDLVNWVINQDWLTMISPSDGRLYTWSDVQRAIWELIEDNPAGTGLGTWYPDHVAEILDAAYTYGENYVPGGDCNDKVAIILIPVNGQQVTIAQVTFIEVQVPCGTVDETAWGFGPEFTEGRSWAMYFLYTVQGEIFWYWPDGGTMSVAYEDLPIGGGNDWDYNDLVVDIHIEALYYGNSEYQNLEQITFTITPEAKMAGYTHVMHLAIGGIFECDGEYELYRDGSLVDSGDYIDATGIDVVLIPNSGSLPDEVILIITFDGYCGFEFTDWDHDTFHGESLFYDPYIYVNPTGEEIHADAESPDIRLLTVPTDWQWPTPDGRSIWLCYPDVTPPPGNPPDFEPYWWEYYVPPPP